MMNTSALHAILVRFWKKFNNQAISLVFWDVMTSRVAESFAVIDPNNEMEAYYDMRRAAKGS
jgi:hypothetical protein